MKTLHTINGTSIEVQWAGRSAAGCALYRVGYEGGALAVVEYTLTGLVQVAGAEAGVNNLRDFAEAITAHRKTVHAQAVKRERNARRRAENAILRELCGTSARAAREDMGI